jgi:hypothetical protein
MNQNQTDAADERLAGTGFGGALRWWPSRTQPTLPLRRRRASDRGIVLILTILAVILLAGMVMFVLNVGRQATRRLQVQHASDATAIAGAGWVARSLNTVAMNNVNMVRLISLVQVLDAMPDSVRFTKEEHEYTLEALKGAVSRGIKDKWVSDTSNDISRQTFYDGPGGRGEFWKAMEASDELSQATMEKLGELTQLNAVRGGAVNLDRMGGKSAAFVVPLKPAIPYARGQFDDFLRPVMHGILPDKIDDKEFKRGPFDTVFGWRYLIGGNQPGYWVGGGGPTTSGGNGNVPIGSGNSSGGGGTFVATGPADPDAYGVRSFNWWMLDRIGNFANDHLPHGRFMYWENRLSSYKLGYLWPGTAIRKVIDPEIITDFDEAVKRAEANPSDIKETWFLAIEMKSKFKRGEGGFMSPGSYSYYVSAGQTDKNTPRTVRLNGWQDPRRWTAEQIGEWQWRDEWDYTTTFDQSIGIAPKPNAQGVLQPQPVYRIDTFIFLGVNVGPEYEIRNPNNFSSRSGLPAPTDLDHSKLNHDDKKARQEFLSFLAFAEVDDSAVAWPSRFTGNKPYPYQVALAEAHVFNNHSWDLWTQMWEAQLKPVEGADAWIGLMESGDTSALPAGVNDAKVKELAKYLGSLREILEAMERK